MRKPSEKVSEKKDSTGQKDNHAQEGTSSAGASFSDLRPETAAQLKLGAIMNESKMVKKSQQFQRIVQNSHSSNLDSTQLLLKTAFTTPEPIQLQLVKDDKGIKTFAMYEKAIENTGSKDALLKIFANHKVQLTGKSGIYLSDNMDDASHATWVGGIDDEISLWLPDKDYFIQHPDKLSVDQQHNGLNAEHNCDLAAEHELIHFMQSRANFQEGNEYMGTAQTPVESFSPKTFDNTVQNLGALAAHADKSGSNKISRFAPIKSFLVDRIKYISEVYDRKGNIEAPTVVRELRKYLEMGGWTEDNFAPIYKRLVELDDECTAHHKGVPQREDKCFLTTACVGYMGKKDDCIELQTLRAFRDGYMSSLPEGMVLIKEYYKIAPTIVAAISVEENHDRIYHSLYKNLVCGSIDLINAGENEKAMKHYKKITLELYQKYGMTKMRLNKYQE